MHAEGKACTMRATGFYELMCFRSGSYLAMLNIIILPFVDRHITTISIGI